MSAFKDRLKDTVLSCLNDAPKKTNAFPRHVMNVFQENHEKVVQIKSDTLLSKLNIY